MEDTSDDEETVLDIQVTIQYPIFLITIEDDTSHSMPEVKENEPPLGEDPIVKATSSLSTIARNGEDLASPPILPPSSPTMTARRQRKSYNRSHFVKVLALLSVVF